MTDKDKNEPGSSEPNSKATETAEHSVNGKDVTESLTPEGTENEAEKLRSEILYLKAEFENYRRRLVRDQEQSIRFANERLIRELLPVVDNFELALSSAKGLKEHADAEVRSFVSGVEMNRRELGQAFERLGAQFVGKIGDPFDPQEHEAISEVPVEAENVGKVVQVVQLGCRLGGRLLKAARVLIGRSQNS